MTVQTANHASLQYQIRNDRLPLAVYRELAAHLRQVEGVEVELLPQQSQQFDYCQSQVGGLRLQYQAAHQEATTTTEIQRRQQVDRILAYYSDRYGAWEELPF